MSEIEEIKGSVIVESDEFKVLEELFAKVNELEKERTGLNNEINDLRFRGNIVFFCLVLVGGMAIIGWLL